MVQAPDKITLPRSARDGRVQRRLQDQLSLLKRRQVTKVAQELKCDPLVERNSGFQEDREGRMNLVTQLSMRVQAPFART